MDNHLRMIANPYLLKRSNEPGQENKQKSIISVNHFLYLYMENKYPNLYIPPVIFYNIIDLIDHKIIEFQIDKLVDEIIDGVLSKFDI